VVEREYQEVERLKADWPIFDWQSPSEKAKSEFIDNIIANGGDALDLRLEGVRSASDQLPAEAAEISYLAYCVAEGDYVKMRQLMNECTPVELYRGFGLQRTRLYVALEQEYETTDDNEDEPGSASNL
jgi:hypothetical protein